MKDAIELHDLEVQYFPIARSVNVHKSRIGGQTCSSRLHCIIIILNIQSEGGGERKYSQ